MYFRTDRAGAKKNCVQKVEWQLFTYAAYYGVPLFSENILDGDTY